MNGSKIPLKNHFYTVGRKAALKVLTVVTVGILATIILPTMAFAEESTDPYAPVDGKMYFTLSINGKFHVSDGEISGEPLAGVSFPINTVSSDIKLTELGKSPQDPEGWGKYNYDADGDGVYEPTLMLGMLYAMKHYSSASLDELVIIGSPHSTYLESGYFGRDQNLTYYVNGQYPLDPSLGSNMGATSDVIVLHDGLTVDVQCYDNWNFWTSDKVGYRYFLDPTASESKIILDYYTTTDTDFPVKMVRRWGNIDEGSPANDIIDEGYPIYWGTTYEYNGGQLGSPLAVADGRTTTLDEHGMATLNLKQPGDYWVWADGDADQSGKTVSAPGFLRVHAYKPPTITTTRLDTGMTGEEYSQTLAGSGDDELVWKVVDGALPSGFTLTEKGNLHGATNEVGDFTFTVEASYGFGKSATKELTLSIAPDTGLYIAPISDQPYTGAPLKPALTVSFGKKTLEAGTDYDVAYINNLRGFADESGVCRATVTVTGKGEYAGTCTRTFKVIFQEPLHRLAGDTRYETMAHIVQTGFQNDHSCPAILLAQGNGYADALMVSALIDIAQAPLLTTTSEELSPEAAAEIMRLSNGSATVYILGGPNSVSETVESQVNALAGISSVERIAGDNRIDTAMKIYQLGLGSWGDVAIVTDAWNYADALSIGAWAAAAHAPLFGTTDGQLNSEQVAALQAGNFNKILVLGGDNSVNLNAIKQQLGSDVQYTRLAGDNRIATSAAIVLWTRNEMPQQEAIEFGPGITLRLKTFAVADAWNYADALTSISLLSQTNEPLVLVDDSAATDTALTLINTSSSDFHSWIFGGEDSIPQSVVDKLTAMDGRA